MGMFKRGAKTKREVPVLTLSLLSIEAEHAAHTWIMVHGPTKLYYSAGQMSCVRTLDMATMYGSMDSAETARKVLNVRLGATLNIENLYDHARHLAGLPPRGEEGDVPAE